jgi:hypothetical protein
MEQIIFIVIVAIVGLIRLITLLAESRKDIGKAAGGAAAQTPPPARRAPQTEEERTRKFLEALGMPTSNDPPQKIQPRPVAKIPVPGRKILPVDPFPKTGRTIMPRPAATPTPSPTVPTSRPPPIPQLLPSPSQPAAGIRAQPADVQQSVPRLAEFGVRSIDDAIVEDAFSHAGARRNRTDAPGISVENVISRLHGENGLRDAIILREIFGPPRSMQPSDRQLAG